MVRDKRNRRISSHAAGVGSLVPFQKPFMVLSDFHRNYSFSIAESHQGEFFPFQKVLDETGFVKGRGRLTEVFNFFGASKTTARNWLEGGACPRNLSEIVTKLYSARRISSSISKDQLIAFLQTGLMNPFEERSAGSDTNSFIFKTCRAYLTVYRMALAQGFDIYDLDDGTLENLYETVFHEIAVRKLEEPNPQLLLNILMKYKRAFG